jgi:hypothetical protein
VTLAVFHHFPKTAGTSLLRLLRENYGPDELLELYKHDELAVHDWSFRKLLNSLSDAERAKIRCLAGHSVQYAIPVLEQPFRAFTLVRDPVDRVVSTFHYLIGTPTVKGRGQTVAESIRERGWTLADIFRTFGGRQWSSIEPEEKIFLPLFNGHVRSILGPHRRVPRLDLGEAGAPEEGRVREKLEEILGRYYVLGTVDDYEASLERFAGVFGWTKLPVHRERVTAERPGLDELDDELVELIRTYNSLDAELHRIAVAQLSQPVATP